MTFSPPELSKKFFFFGEFSAEDVQEELRQTRSKLSVNAIRALIQISGIHRGVFVRLCEWVKTTQEDMGDDGIWSEADLYRNIKMSMKKKR